MASEDSPLQVRDSSNEEEKDITVSDNRELGDHDPANFLHFSIAFAAVSASVLACLALAVVELEGIGAKQSGILYASYTVSALVIGSPPFRNRRDAVVLGQALLTVYVASFGIVGMIDIENDLTVEGICWTAACIGGIGAAMMWTSQGVYFSAACDGSVRSAAVFAAILLIEETILDVLSTVLVQWVDWSFVFVVYLVIAVAATFATWFVKPLPRENLDLSCISLSQLRGTMSLWATDSKLKYFIGFNISFGLAGALLNSIISAEVVPAVMGKTSMVGMLVAWHGLVASVASMVRAPMWVGALAFGALSIPFLVQPDWTNWNWVFLVVLYSLQGVGRAAFEGAQKAVFAVYFDDKEAAFANITLQNGIASVVGYVLTTQLDCSSSSASCLEFRDGTSHRVDVFAGILFISSVSAIVGLKRADYLHRTKQLKRRQPEMSSEMTSLPRHDVLNGELT